MVKTIDSDVEFVQGTTDSRGRLTLGTEFADSEISAMVIRAKPKDDPEAGQVDGVADFSSHLYKDPDGVVLKDTVYSAYRSYCADANFDAVPKQEFSRLLLEMRDDVETTRRRVDGAGRVRCYEGVSLDEEAAKKDAASRSESVNSP